MPPGPRPLLPAPLDKAAITRLPFFIPRFLFASLFRRSSNAAFGEVGRVFVVPGAALGMGLLAPPVPGFMFGGGAIPTFPPIR